MDGPPLYLLDRLRANLAAARIPATAEDIEAVVQGRFLQGIDRAERLWESTPADTVPDYLKDWSPDASSPAPPQANGYGPPPEDSIAHLAPLVESRQVSPVELARTALDRIRQHESLNAFQLVLAEEALESARAAEREIGAGRYRGPLHGVPVAVKDLLAMEGTPTTAGSRLFEGWGGFDSAAVELLREAGAVIVGKTKLSELAYAPGSLNAHYGPTCNPWNPKHDAGGSSSGSTAAVNAGIVYMGLGSDTGGSIRIPASNCGVVGLKPTFGRVSLYGAVPLSWSLDHLGPITRTVTDAALTLDALAGHDPRDIRTRQRPAQPYSASVDGGVRRLRVGVVRSDGRDGPLASPEVLQAWQAGLEALRAEGAELVEIDLPELEELRYASGAILSIEAGTYHRARLRDRLQELGPFPRARLLSGFAYGQLTYVQAQQRRSVLRGRLEALFERLDVISTPTMPDPAPELGVNSAVTYTSPFNCLGWPCITVPVGLAPGRLPIGLQLAARPWDEPTVLRAARAVEAAGPWQGKRPEG